MSGVIVLIGLFGFFGLLFLLAKTFEEQSKHNRHFEEQKRGVLFIKILKIIME
jgi:hypothetical protein